MERMYTIEHRIMEFNKSSDQYRVVINDYSIYDHDRELQRNLLNADIAAGKIADLYMYGTGTSILYPIDNYKDMGLFADYFELFENDGSASPDILSPIVTTAFAENGKLYSMPWALSVETLAGKKSNFPAVGWTPIEMIEYSERLDDDQHMMIEMFRMLNQSRVHWEYIDYENKTTNFDDENYKRMTEFRKNYDKISYDDMLFDMPRVEVDALLRDDKLMLKTAILHNFFQLADLKNTMGEELSFVGFPSIKGNYAYIDSGHYYSVSAKSSEGKTKGAWEFVKFILSDTTQQRNYAQYTDDKHSFPVTQNMWKKLAQEALGSTYAFLYPTGFGGSSFQVCSNPPTEDELARVELLEKEYNATATFVTLTKDDIDALESMMSHASPPFNDDEVVRKIIYDELSPYTSGNTTKTYDEVTAIAKSRIELYLNERS
jgi:hypothetical protein